MNELEQYESPIYTEEAHGPAPRLISRRMYNLVLTGLVVLSFAVMGACSQMTSTLDFWLFVGRNPMMFTLLTLAGSIGGIITMSIGRARESLTLGMIGYTLFTLTFGFTTSMTLSMYSMESISAAFTATAGIMIVFGLAGIAFPRFFERIVPVCCLGLLAVIVVEFALMLFGIQQTMTDIVVILLFCGFIGYDVHRAATAVPTLTNAVWYAIELYLDIINVFLRLLAIFGRRD